jgi:hypothetical protein
MSVERADFQLTRGLEGVTALVGEKITANGMELTLDVAAEKCRST